MNITAHIGSLTRHPVALSVLGVFEESGSLAARLPLTGAAKQGLVPLLESVHFRGQSKESVVLPTRGPFRSRWVAVVGLGKRKEFTLQHARVLGSVAIQTARNREFPSVAVQLPVHDRWHAAQVSQAITEGLVLGQYRFLTFKRQLKPQERFQVRQAFVVGTARDATAVQQGTRIGTVVAQAANFVRDLCNTPANVATPTYLADQARQLAKTHRLRCQVFSTPELKRLQMGGILSVTQGSVQPPRLVIMESTPATNTRPTVVFIGKGITFDSGGISIKPSGGMEKMKYDMSGAAAVLGILQASAALKLPFHLVGIFAACENLPSGSATKPGDIVTTHAGKTVEILNTDAEGRMILADCLAYAKRFHPQAVVDLATLTGACVVALGKYAIGMMGTDERLKHRLRAAGELSGERVWELPLWPDYTDGVRGDVSDLKNIGPPGEAGAIAAAAFLKEFTSYPWVHLDIAGTAWAEHADTWQPKGSTGVGVRLAIQMLRTWAEELSEAKGAR